MIIPPLEMYFYSLSWISIFFLGTMDIKKVFVQSESLLPTEFVPGVAEPMISTMPSELSSLRFVDLYLVYSFTLLLYA